MKALVVTPGRGDSARLVDLPEPSPQDGAVLVEMLAVGVCGTDREILRGAYGRAPAGEDALVLGHESLGRVVSAPPDSGLAGGDLVVAMVRRPDPVPCINCAAGEWDMCRNGKYTEHGIKGVHGFCRERYRLAPERLVRIEPQLGEHGVLLEPTSVVAKAWEHAVRIGERARFSPRRCLITGAGPIGLLAALLATQRGLEVHVLDRVTDGAKPRLVRQLSATYHADDASLARLSGSFDVVLECTGAPRLVLAAPSWCAPDGVVCLAGVSSGGREFPVDVGGLGRAIVLENTAIFGSVNANRRHYEQAAAALARADPTWLAGLITRRVPLARWREALERRPDDVKTVILGPAGAR